MVMPLWVVEVFIWEMWNFEKLQTLDHRLSHSVRLKDVNVEHDFSTGGGLPSLGLVGPLRSPSTGRSADRPDSKSAGWLRAH